MQLWNKVALITVGLRVQWGVRIAYDRPGHCVLGGYS